MNVCERDQPGLKKTDILVCPGNSLLPGCGSGFLLLAPVLVKGRLLLFLWGLWVSLLASAGQFRSGAAVQYIKVPASSDGRPCGQQHGQLCGWSCGLQSDQRHDWRYGWLCAPTPAQPAEGLVDGPSWSRQGGCHTVYLLSLLKDCQQSASLASPKGSINRHRIERPESFLRWSDTWE